MTNRPLSVLPALVSAALALGASLATPLAHAQSADEIRIARQTAGDGLGAYRAGEFEQALRLFEDARAVYPSGQILRMLGYTNLALERWAAAVESLEASLSTTTAPLGGDDRKDTEQHLDKALAHFGKVAVTTTVEGAELSVDGGEARSMPLDAPLRLIEGAHLLVLRGPGVDDLTREIAVIGGESLEVALEPDAPEPPPPPPPPKPAAKAEPERWSGLFPGQREIGLAVGGVGVVLGVAAIGTALGGAHLRAQVESDVAIHEGYYGSNCATGDRRLCAYDREVINHTGQRADGLRDASVWMGIGAGVLVAGGATLYLLAPDGPLAPSAPAKDGRDARARKPRAVTSLACGPLGPLGVSCAGSF